MEQRISKRIVNMLILTVPSICFSLGEPEMNNGLVMDININIKSIREYMVSIVFVAPPSRAES